MPKVKKIKEIKSKIKVIKEISKDSSLESQVETDDFPQNTQSTGRGSSTLIRGSNSVQTIEDTSQITQSRQATEEREVSYTASRLSEDNSNKYNPTMRSNLPDAISRAETIGPSQGIRNTGMVDPRTSRGDPVSQISSEDSLERQYSADVKQVKRRKEFF